MKLICWYCGKKLRERVGCAIDDLKKVCSDASSSKAYRCDNCERSYFTWAFKEEVAGK